MSQYPEPDKEITAPGESNTHPYPWGQQIMPVAPPHPWEQQNVPVAPPPPSTEEEINQKFLTLSSEKQKDIVIKAMGSLSIQDKKEIVQDLGIKPLSQDATDFVWKAVISGAVIVFVGSFGAIVAAVFLKADVAPLITVFSAVIAFIGGLLAPSPIQSAIKSISSNFKSSGKTSD